MFGIRWRNAFSVAVRSLAAERSKAGAAVLVLSVAAAAGYSVAAIRDSTVGRRLSWTAGEVVRISIDAGGDRAQEELAPYPSGREVALLRESAGSFRWIGAVVSRQAVIAPSGAREAGIAELSPGALAALGGLTARRPPLRRRRSPHCRRWRRRCGSGPAARGPRDRPVRERSRRSRSSAGPGPAKRPGGGRDAERLRVSQVRHRRLAPGALTPRRPGFLESADLRPARSRDLRWSGSFGGGPHPAAGGTPLGPGAGRRHSLHAGAHGAYPPDRRSSERRSDTAAARRGGQRRGPAGLADAVGAAFSRDPPDIRSHSGGRARRRRLPHRASGGHCRHRCADGFECSPAPPPRLRGASALRRGLERRNRSSGPRLSDCGCRGDGRRGAFAGGTPARADCGDGRGPARVAPPPPPSSCRCWPLERPRPRSPWSRLPSSPAARGLCWPAAEAIPTPTSAFSPWTSAAWAKTRRPRETTASAFSTN